MKNHVLRKQELYAELVGGGKLLDVGFAQYPNPYLKNVIGVDIQDKAKPRNYKEVYRINLNKEKLPFKDASFDGVVAGEVIEHVENPSLLLREINRVLKKNCKLIISTPNATYYWEIIRNYFFSFVSSNDEGEHLSNWTILDFQKLLNRNGFLTKKRYGTIFTLPDSNKIVKIPVKWFPKLGWVIIYETIKVNSPDSKVYTHTQLPNNKYPIIKIKQ